MNAVERTLGARRVLIGHVHDGRRRSLERCSLHEVQYTAHATHLFASTRPPGPTVHEMRQGRTMTGRLLPAVAIHDHESPMVGGSPTHDVACDAIIRGE